MCGPAGVRLNDSELGLTHRRKKAGAKCDNFEILRPAQSRRFDAIRGFVGRTNAAAVGREFFASIGKVMPSI
jgi:hypothetical protein